MKMTKTPEIAMGLFETSKIAIHIMPEVTLRVILPRNLWLGKKR